MKPANFATVLPVAFLVLAGEGRTASRRRREPVGMMCIPSSRQAAHWFVLNDMT